MRAEEEEEKTAAKTLQAHGDAAESSKKKKNRKGFDPFTSASEVNHQQFHRFREMVLRKAGIFCLSF